MLKSIQVKILDKRLGNEFPLPTYQHDGDAAIDLIACLEDTVVIHPKDSAQLIGTGLSIYIADPGYAAIILPRSGLGHQKGLILGNTCGLIDSSYQGELLVSAWNRTLAEPIFLRPGDRFAQLMFVPIARPSFEIVEDFKAKSKRGKGGFGSTGQ